MTPETVVVDASAVLAWIFDERGAEVVEGVLPTSVLSAVNFAEVLYCASDEGMDASSLARDLVAFGIQVVPFTQAEAAIVESLRARARPRGVRLSLADYCCLATAVRLDLPVMGANRAWRALDAGVEVRLLR
ncbi:MAG: type II toxin-antitoxin system VapC family toxin [Acidobacteria bacterium]|nr:type II toxin-antitoxin system VapC family toxin [Acidobacteriota bacterium]